MQIIRDAQALAAALAPLRGAPTASGGGRHRVALVPTMGALHEGHMSLVTRAAQIADRVVATIFVNPTQFGPSEDFAAYPRTEAADAAMLADAGVAILYAPPPADIYRPGHATHIHVAALGDRWCGAARPGHFDGVATVVAKLLNRVAPDVALFGEKDWQQLAIIRRMVADLDLPVAIEAVPIARAPDGLALSSRNAYLKGADRAVASALPGALRDAAGAIIAGTPVTTALDVARAAVLRAGFSHIDYLALIDGATLDPVARVMPGARLIAAARIGGTRLIDNLPLASA